MKISFAISALIVTATTSVLAANNITYKVVSLVPNNQTVGVIVDEKLYSLENVDKSSTLLHYGEAPVATSGYKYAIIQKDSNEVVQMENFTRSSSNDNTLNEYFGRSWNIFPNMTKLPNILPPLPIINRVKSDLHIEGQIPTIHLTGNQTAIDNMHENQLEEIKIDLSMSYISPNDIKIFKNITLSVGGMSNRRMPKLSYKIKLDKKDDLYGYRRLKLRSMVMDPTFMKENLGYNMAESIGLFSSQHSYVRVYMNNQAIGLFGLVEHMKSNWVRNEFGNGSKKFKQGALFIADINAQKNGTTSDDSIPTPKNQETLIKRQVDENTAPSNDDNAEEQFEKMFSHSKTDLSYLGNNVSDYSYGQYSVKEDPSVGTANFTRIMDLTKFISEQPNTTTDNSAIPLWEEKMDVNSFLRGIAFEILISNMDGYLGISNNYVLYDDISTDRLIFSAQDLDLCMGITIHDPYVLHGGNYSNYLGMNQRPVPTHMLQVPQFKQDFENLMLNMTKGLIHPSALGPRVDQLFNMLSEDVAWDFSLPRVGKLLMFPGVNGTGPANPPGTNETGPANPSGANGTEPTNPLTYLGSLSNIPYKTFVYGPTITNISMSLMDWANFKSSNILTFFNQTSS